MVRLVLNSFSFLKRIENLFLLGSKLLRRNQLLLEHLLELGEPCRSIAAGDRLPPRGGRLPHGLRYGLSEANAGPEPHADAGSAPFVLGGIPQSLQLLHGGI